jgi:rhodanese-related sulfurtransferase
MQIKTSNMGFFSKLFSSGPKVDLKELAKTAVILDVRTPGEYKQGHIKGSKNAPLNELDKHLKGIDKNQAIITCCASGMRSGSAKGALQAKGYTNVHNGGGWTSLKSKIA